MESDRSEHSSKSITEDGSSPTATKDGNGRRSSPTRSSERVDCSESTSITVPTSTAPTSTPSGLSAGTSKRGASRPVTPCEWCQTPFEWIKASNNGKPYRFCSRSCAISAAHAARRGHRLLATAKCEWCETDFPLNYQRQKQRFCSRACSAQWQSEQPGRLDAFVEAGRSLAAERKGKPGRPMGPSSRRGIPQAAETRAKISASLRGRRWNRDAGYRRITRQQVLVCRALGLSDDNMEWNVWDGKSYWSIDIAEPLSRTAIEIDGSSHRLVRQQQIDRAKEQALRSLGWTVLRFWNQEIDDSLSDVVAAILSSTTWKSTVATTS